MPALKSFGDPDCAITQQATENTLGNVCEALRLASGDAATLCNRDLIDVGLATYNAWMHFVLEFNDRGLVDEDFLDGMSDLRQALDDQLGSKP